MKSTADYILPGLLLGGVVVAFITAFMAAIVVILMSHRLAGPMYRFEKYAQEIGSGKLSSNLKIREKDQFQSMVPAFNAMTQSLNGGLSEIIGVSEKLDVLIEDLSDSSDREKPLKEDIKKVVSELKKYRSDLKKALSYFKIND